MCARKFCLLANSSAARVITVMVLYGHIGSSTHYCAPFARTCIVRYTYLSVQKGRLQILFETAVTGALFHRETLYVHTVLPATKGTFTSTTVLMACACYGYRISHYTIQTFYHVILIIASTYLIILSAFFIITVYHVHVFPCCSRSFPSHI